MRFDATRLCWCALVVVLVLGPAGCGGGDEPAVHPDREPAYRANNLGVAHLEQFEHADAAERFREALSIDPGLSIARLNLSLALFYSQDLEGARREAEEAARLLPSAPQPAYLLGLIARAQNRNADAQRHFEQVLGIDPRDVGTIVNLAQIYLEERRYADAIELLQRAAADEPYHVTVAYVLGLARMRNGDAAEGQELLTRAQALRDTPYGVSFGTTYLEQGQYAQAIASTGAEPELVNAAVPAVRFTRMPVAGAPAAGTPSPSPFGRQFEPGRLDRAGALDLAAGLGGAVTTADFDGDGDHDLFAVSAGGERLLRNDGGDAWSDVTAAAGLTPTPPDSMPVGAVAADWDNDGAVDLFVLRYGRSTLYRNEGGGRFADATAAADLPRYPHLPGAAAFADVDHDGDVDLIVAGLADLAATRKRTADRALVFPDGFAPAPLQLLRNNRDGTFSDVTREAKLDVVSRAIAIVPSDVDNRRDVDLLVVGHDGAHRLFKNLRDGTFSDVAGDAGLLKVSGQLQGVRAVAAGDIDHDDFPDLFFAGAGGSAFALSDGRGAFTVADAPPGAAGAAAAQFLDYDSDGLLDLLTWHEGGPRLFRNVGAEWTDATSSAIASAADAAGLVSGRALAVADFDGDGRSDFAAWGAAPAVWRNSGETPHRSMKVALRGLASNRSGIGSKVQIRAGSLRARLETSAATPAVAPADLVVGLGPRPGADVVRVLWPSGILQAEAAEAGARPEGTAAAVLPSALAVAELDRKPSSCPYLFTWNGTRFEFVTDFLGAGELGYWMAPGVRNTPDPVEYVRIRGDQLMPKDGMFELRVTNELEETVFVDRLELRGILHRADTEVHPNEGMTDPPKPARLHAVRHARPPALTRDDAGRDVSDLVANLDGRAPRFSQLPFRGYARPHHLTIDLGALTEPPVLLLTGWTDYAFSSDNVAAHQAGLALEPPRLEILDAGGHWRASDASLGIPVGRPQTIATDLSGHIRPGERHVRLVTNMRIHWDQIRVGRRAPAGDANEEFVLHAAVLRERGFSREQTAAAGSGPARYEYEAPGAASPWKVMAGRYTREGDVRALLAAADDMFVITRPGDEIALQFDARNLAAVPEGWTRTFLLVARGYSKEMDVNSAAPDAVEPLPFRGMTRYPYPATERYPETAEHREYRREYNTRPVVRPVPPIELAR